MTNWKALAAAADPPLPDDARANAAAALEQLEAAFRRLEANLAVDTLPWSGPGDGE